MTKTTQTSQNSQNYKDIQYQSTPYQLNELEHRYGDKVHLLNNPFLKTLLAKICRKDLFQPALNHYFEFLYSHLFAEAFNLLVPSQKVEWDTRMKDLNPAGTFAGDILDQEQKAIIVSMARAGTFPGHIGFEQLNYLLNPKNIRQDHFYLNRKLNDDGKVDGVDVSGSKIGGDQDKAMVFFPDPMGATGGSLNHCLDHYKKMIEGKAKCYIGLHLIVTPEFVKAVTEKHPDVHLFALRLDRGLSDQEVLNSVPGTFWEREKGLNENQYIVPGAGGVGEILNNSFV